MAKAGEKFITMMVKTINKEKSDMNNFLTKLFKTNIPNTGKNYLPDSVIKHCDSLQEEWLEFDAWAWMRIANSGHFDPVVDQKKWEQACEIHKMRVKKLEELLAEQKRVTHEMMVREAPVEEIEAYDASVYPEIHMWLMASRSLL